MTAQPTNPFIGPASKPKRSKSELIANGNAYLDQIGRQDCRWILDHAGNIRLVPMSDYSRSFNPPVRCTERDVALIRQEVALERCERPTEAEIIAYCKAANRARLPVSQS